MAEVSHNSRTGLADLTSYLHRVSHIRWYRT